jgi:hypothetical protein
MELRTSQLVQKFAAFSRTKWFITMFTKLATEYLNEHYITIIELLINIKVSLLEGFNIKNLLDTAETVILWTPFKVTNG